MSRVVITPASVVSLGSLQRLFVKAVAANFDYFPLEVQAQIISDHSMGRLLLASIDPRRIILVARSRREIIGYAIGATPKNGPAQLFWLYVDPAYRGSNTGLSLLSRALRHLSSKGARVVSIATHEHRSYYERQGFKFVEKSTVHGVEMDIMIFRIARTTS
jgi:ribosomal protein S18 acetylase RimI-like enzyme